MEPVARFDQVTFAYPGGAPVIRDLSFVVQAGEGIALLGHNGAGKTTVTRLAVALLHPRHGRVEVDGKPTAGRAPEDYAGSVGYLFQHPESQLFERTVEADVGFGPRQMGWDEARIRDAVAGVLDRLGLGGEPRVHPYDLPLPRRRLVALASALVIEPALLLLDEPTAGLDRASRTIVLRVVAEHRERGGAVLAVTHDLGFAAEALDRALVLSGGRLLQDAPLGQVLGMYPEVPVPPVVELGRWLGLTDAGCRRAAVARALAQRCRPSGRGLS
ncbi:MAG: energy-coupling factor ABC transporter ATP-binding protein [Gemmatimonadales bacterium]